MERVAEASGWTQNMTETASRIAGKSKCFCTHPFMLETWQMQEIN